MGCPILMLMKYHQHSPSITSLRNTLEEGVERLSVFTPSLEKLLLLVDANGHSNPQLVNAQRIRDCSAPNGMFLWHPSLQGPGIFKEEEMERLQEPEAVSKPKETVFSSHARAHAHTNSETGAAHTGPV